MSSNKEVKTYNAYLKKKGVGEARALPLHIRVARGFFSRAKGLLGCSSLPLDEALLLPQTTWVHTWGMRFSIDVVILNSDGWVKKVVDQLPPGTMTGAMVWGGQTLEMAAGRRRELGLEIGDLIYVDSTLS
jgi:hypothetical protein